MVTHPFDITLSKIYGTNFQQKIMADSVGTSFSEQYFSFPTPRFNTNIPDAPTPPLIPLGESVLTVWAHQCHLQKCKITIQTSAKNFTMEVCSGCCPRDHNHKTGRNCEKSAQRFVASLQNARDLLRL